MNSKAALIVAILMSLNFSFSATQPLLIKSSSQKEENILNSLRNQKNLETLLVCDTTLKAKCVAIKALLLTRTTKDSADYLIAVMRIETGNFKSKRFLKNKNVCGMRFPTTVRKKDSAKYAIYDSIDDSVNDLLAYVRYYKQRSWYHSKRYKHKIK